MKDFNKLKIEDYLNNLPYEDLAVIINDYEEANNFQPVYFNSEKVINDLKAKGKKVKPFNMADFAFLTVNRYNVVEPIANIHEFINYDTELIPYIMDNLSKYNLDSIALKDDAETDKLEKKVVQAYNNFKGEDFKKLSQLPKDTWQDVFAKLISDKNEEEIDRQIFYLTKSENEKMSEIIEEPSEKKLDDLCKKYFGCSYKDEKGLRKYGSDHNVDSEDDFMKTLSKMFGLYFDKEIPYYYIQKYLYNVYVRAGAYQNTRFHEQTLGQKEHDKEIEKIDKAIHKEVMEHFENFKTDEIAVETFEKYYPQLRELFLNEDITQDEYEDKLVILIQRCEKTYKVSEFNQARNYFDKELHLEHLVLAVDEAIEKDSKSKEIKSGFVNLWKAFLKSSNKNEIVRVLQTIDENDFIEKLKEYKGFNLEKIEADILNEESE